MNGTKPVPLAETIQEPVIEEETVEDEPVTFNEEEFERRIEEFKQELIEDNNRRFEAAVQAKAQEFLNARRRQLDAEYNRIVESGNNNAERLLEDAKAKTRAVFEAAEEECTRIKERSSREGFEAGFQAGWDDGVKKCDKYLEAAAKLLADINAHKEAYYISNEYELRETVLDMVRKITMEEIKTAPAVIDRIAANAAKNFRNSDYIKISVCKGEASRELVSDKEYLASIIPFIPEIEIEELDPEDTPHGTVVLDNGSEIIDASVPTQLDFLREIMKNSRGEQEVE